MRCANVGCKMLIILTVLGSTSRDAKQLVGELEGLQLIHSMCLQEDLVTSSKLVRCALCAVAVSLSSLFFRSY